MESSGSSRSLVRAVLAAACLVLLLLAVTAAAEGDGMPGPPDRPENFNTPDELRNYLKALNEYFAIVGRPRFGRSAQRRSLSSFARRALSPAFARALELDE